MKTQCPELPTKLATYQDVLCARLWGRPTEELERRINAEHAPWDCALELDHKPQKPRANADYKKMLSAARTRPPFTLGR